MKTAEHKISQSKRRGTLDLKGFQKLICFVKMHFLARRVNNMFLVKVVDQVSSKFSPPLSKIEARNAIQVLVRALPQWLAFVKLECGELLRVLKKISMNELKAAFREFYPKFLKEIKKR